MFGQHQYGQAAVSLRRCVGALSAGRSEINRWASRKKNLEESAAGGSGRRCVGERELGDRPAALSG
jgi:hypothetical protein